MLLATSRIAVGSVYIPCASRAGRLSFVILHWAGTLIHHVRAFHKRRRFYGIHLPKTRQRWANGELSVVSGSAGTCPVNRLWITSTACDGEDSVTTTAAVKRRQNHFKKRHPDAGRANKPGGERGRISSHLGGEKSSCGRHIREWTVRQ